MVFLKRSTSWTKDNTIICNANSPKQQLLSKPIESLIDEVHETTLRVFHVVDFLFIEGKDTR